jgi:hypothetical protein
VPAEHDTDHGDGEDDGHPELHGAGPYTGLGDPNLRIG